MSTAKEIVDNVHTGVAEIAQAADDLSLRTERQASSLKRPSPL